MVIWTYFSEKKYEQSVTLRADWTAVLGVETIGASHGMCNGKSLSPSNLLRCRPEVTSMSKSLAGFIASSQAEGDAAWPAIPDLGTCQRLPRESGDSRRWPLPCRAMNRKMLPRESTSKEPQEDILIAW